MPDTVTKDKNTYRIPEKWKCDSTLNPPLPES